MKEKTKRTKTNKGITLIALILTIIVLLILAVVAINAVKGDGIIAHAKNAKTDYTKAQSNEKSTLQGYLDKLEESQLASGKIKDNLNKVLSTGANITLEDDFGNKIKVPAGFKIITKTDTENTDLNYTADDIDITKGIVVEDEEENQFVWIPVGKIYTDAEKTEANAKTITLGRYENFNKTNNAYTVAQNASDYATQVTIDNHFTEDTTANHNSNYKNSIAKNIGEFCMKSLASGGYYIGRYEARTGTERNSETDALTSVTLKANDFVYNWITQPQASERCRSMYTSNLFTSDLVNSYAWDTSIIFFQEFGGDEDSHYAYKGRVNSTFALRGTSGKIYTGTKDIICNVYDMATNCNELSTETSSYSDLPCPQRGGCYYDSSSCASRRNCFGKATTSFVGLSFRPILYM